MLALACQVKEMFTLRSYHVWQLIFFIVVSRDWNIHQFDIHNAFLNNVLDEEVYMKQSLGFVDFTFPSHVCLLHKSLYGLK